MLRLLLTWLLLLNYLLVVGVGLVVSRPPAAPFSAAHPYVHSKECQQRNYLRLDCFEHCNGDQHEVRRAVPTGSGLHYLAQLKGLDVHCPAAIAVGFGAPRQWRAGARYWRLVAAPLPARPGERDYPPPRRA